MISVYSVVVTLVLFSELGSRLVTVAMPSTKADDGAAEQDSVDSILADVPVSELAAVPQVYRRTLALDTNGRDDGTPKIVVLLSDPRLKGQSVRGLSSALARNHPLLTDRSLSSPGVSSLKVDRRDTDLDMLRCMIGRVYRPCWEA
ncbi:unnamed protein product [Menidia menidia]|uniref:(Atlantic silverside) hypothetical protein n=1 Tax=Menidia menidia TaxID=238744 RepID=A0A8S4B7Q9_9TELE|nr:unnamed protein product [Menidia menidia]